MAKQKALAQHAFVPNDPNLEHVADDDFGGCTKDPGSVNCGDDTNHTRIDKKYSISKHFQAQDNTQDINGETMINLVFIQHLNTITLKLVKQLTNQTSWTIENYTDESITTRTFLQLDAKTEPMWKDNKYPISGLSRGGRARQFERADEL